MNANGPADRAAHISAPGSLTQRLDDAPSSRGHAKRRLEPWVTGADRAELALLVREFVDGAFEHRPTCEACLAGDPCSALRDAIEIVLDWRNRRSSRSFAVAMRARQDLADWLGCA